jgi:hypothetical protein
MNLVIFAGSWLACVAGRDASMREVGLWFIGLQVCLAYCCYGATKLAAPSWRKGDAIVAALSTYSHGNETLHRIVSTFPKLGLALCWMTIGWECAFSLAIVLPSPACAAILFSGVLFHASIAMTMGFNLFFWSFLASYPAVWWIAVH